MIENIKCAVGGDVNISIQLKFRFISYNARNMLIQNIAILKFFLHCILLSSMFEILLDILMFINIHLGGKNNSSPIAHFRFSKKKKNGNVVRIFI